MRVWRAFCIAAYLNFLSWWMSLGGLGDEVLTEGDELQ